MKQSKYNYIVPFKDNTIFFNGISEAFFVASSNHAEAYKTIIQNPEQHKMLFRDFIKKMKTDGFIIDDEENEIDKIKQKYNALRKNNQYMLLILPTYACNLRCWYCTQKHENMFMSDNTISRLKKLIISKLSDNDITDFHISWFGGEPMMAYDKVIDITLFSKNLSNRLGKSFSASMTTNGTLLNRERIEALREAGLRHYQITIDGNRKMHNSIKKLGNISAYDRTIENINIIARDTAVNLRFNYTKDNLNAESIFKDLLETLNPEVRHNIAFTIFKVWQEKQENICDADVDSLFEYGKKAGMYSTLYSPGPCYTDQYHYDCIFPNGHVAKCDNHSPLDSPGRLTENGSIEWIEDMSKYYEPHIFDSKQKECCDCKYLPICWGPCVAKREDMLRNTGFIKCHYTSRDIEMTRVIQNIIKTRLQSTSIDTN